MKVVETLEEIMENTKTIDKYLNLDDSVQKEFAKDLVKRGICFIVLDRESKLRFYPSRFVGYKKNDYQKHINNYEKDGRDTNPAISKIINLKPTSSEDLEIEYTRYCEDLGFASNKSGAYGVKRKYWKL